MTEQSDPADSTKGQPLIEHLIELRSRLLKIAGFILVIFIPLFFFANDLYSVAVIPLARFPTRGRDHDCHRSGVSLFNAL